MSRSPGASPRRNPLLKDSLLGSPEIFTNLFINNLSDKPYPSVATAKAAGAPTINYGVFLNTILTFLIIAFVVFLLVKKVNRMRRGEEAPAEKTTKECPCLSAIPIKATRCPHCISELKPAA